MRNLLLLLLFPVVIFGAPGPGPSISGGGVSSNRVYQMIIDYGTYGTNEAMGIAAGSGIVITTNGNLRTISLYTAPIIAAFTNDQNIVEVGSTVLDTILGWTLTGGSITSQSLNQGIGARPIGDRTYTDTADYTTSRTYTLTVGDGISTIQANSSVSFQRKIYWGVTNLTSLNNAQIQGLSQQFATTRVIEVAVSPAIQYVYFAYPESFGVGGFTVGGLDFDAITPTTVSFQNASGDTVNYLVYRTNELLDSTFTFAIQ